jgi:hypothetical protein
MIHILVWRQRACGEIAAVPVPIPFLLDVRRKKTELEPFWACRAISLERSAAQVNSEAMKGEFRNFTAQSGAEVRYSFASRRMVASQGRGTRNTRITRKRKQIAKAANSHPA